MVRNYVPKRPKAFTKEELSAAVNAMRREKGKLTFREAAANYGIPKSTLSRYMHKKNTFIWLLDIPKHCQLLKRHA